MPCRRICGRAAAGFSFSGVGAMLVDPCPCLSPAGQQRQGGSQCPCGLDNGSICGHNPALATAGNAVRRPAAARHPPRYVAVTVRRQPRHGCDTLRKVWHSARGGMGVGKPYLAVASFGVLTHFAKCGTTPEGKWVSESHISQSLHSELCHTSQSVAQRQRGNARQKVIPRSHFIRNCDTLCEVWHNRTGGARDREYGADAPASSRRRRLHRAQLGPCLPSGKAVHAWAGRLLRRAANRMKAPRRCRTMTF